MPTLYSALIDTQTSALLALSSTVPIIAFLAASSDAEHVPYVNHPNYLKRFDLAAANPETYPDQRWHPSTRLFTPTPAELRSERLKHASLLAVKKSRALFEINYLVESMRYPVWSGLVCQDLIYAEKRAEARAFKYDKERRSMDDYPYVMQFAELSGLHPLKAAEEILLKASLADEVLLHSEYYRLKYLDQLKQADHVALVDPIVIAFRREFFAKSKAN